MKRYLAPAIVCCCLAMVLAPAAANETTAEDERASAFVAGTADPSENFSPAEAKTLLVVAGLCIVVPFILLMLNTRTHRSCAAKLDDIEATLSSRDGSHA
ncbi:MAG: hypothetical protein GY762_04955 [Proteobacteria bacterium]|nr:hypothetical protein [Pseudomonadota bacterium]